MTKVYTLPASEDWIVDRMQSEWVQDNADISVDRPENADVIWLLASWCWRHVPAAVLTRKKVLATIHHIVPEKFDISKRRDFEERDKYVTAYHVYNKTTQDVVKTLTDKDVHLLPYWANQKIWRKTGTKLELRAKYSLPVDRYLVGSFQRDTEGSDLKTPKLEKGPDLLLDFLDYLKSNWRTWTDTISYNDIHVVLSGWRRQYVIKGLVDRNINFTYIELPSQQIVNDLYQTLDLYPVTSRHEGGPQSLIECGLLDVPVISRDVGIASDVLSPLAVSNDVKDASPCVPKVDNLVLPGGYSLYRNLLLSL